MRNSAWPRVDRGVGDPPTFELRARVGNPDFLDLPWSTPLANWQDPRLVDVARGISRHVVRFVDYSGAVYALKELPEPVARREYELLRELTDRRLPVVDAVGVATRGVDERGDALDAVLITRHLSFSLPYRMLFAGRAVADLQNQLLDALAVLLVRLHLEGFFWGDCSLSNALFRRDAGALSAYLVDAETGSLGQERLSDGQRRHELALTSENVGGELLDLQAMRRLPEDFDPLTVISELERRYERLWTELNRPEILTGPLDRHRLTARVRRLNELGLPPRQTR